MPTQTITFTFDPETINNLLEYTYAHNFYISFGGENQNGWYTILNGHINPDNMNDPTLDSVDVTIDTTTLDATSKLYVSGISIGNQLIVKLVPISDTTVKDINGEDYEFESSTVYVGGQKVVTAYKMVIIKSSDIPETVTFELDPAVKTLLGNNTFDFTVRVWPDKWGTPSNYTDHSVSLGGEPETINVVSILGSSGGTFAFIPNNSDYNITFEPIGNNPVYNSNAFMWYTQCFVDNDEVYALNTNYKVMLEGYTPEEPEEPTEDTNNYEEYLYINGEWEKIGSASSGEGSVDLDGYATEEYVDEAIAGISTSSSGYGLPTKTTVKDEYLVEYEYDNLDWKAGREFSEAFTTPGACTVAVDIYGFMVRNFDWKYDNSKTGIITTKGAKHNVIGCVNIREDIELTDDMLRAMPFAIVDGINDAGLQAAVLVIPKQEHSGDIMSISRELKDTIPANMVVRYILENYNDIGEAESFPYNIKVTPSAKLSAMGYEAHWIVSQNGRTIILEPGTIYNSATGEWQTQWKIAQCASWFDGAWENNLLPVLTNFRVTWDTRIFNNDWTVGTPGDSTVSSYMEPQSTGLERYNEAVNGLYAYGTAFQLIINGNIKPYTDCYLRPASYYSDFVDADHDLSTVKDFVDAHIQDIQDAFYNRTRNGETWQTVHCIVTYFDPNAEPNVNLALFQCQEGPREESYSVSTSLESSLAKKADISSVYTKSQVDSSLANKANTSSVYTKAEVDSSLANKANTSSVYTKAEIDSALANAGLQYEVKGEI